jgi:D-alanine---D-serine ligase
LLPAPVSESVTAAIKETAVKLYNLFGCKGFARVDMFYSDDGRIIFNEINTIPGMTQHSRFPKMMRAAGISFNEMVQRLLDTAVEDKV